MAHVTCLCVFLVSSMGRDFGKKGKRIVFNVLPGCNTLSMRSSQILSPLAGSHEATLFYLHHCSSSWKHGTPFSESPLSVQSLILRWMIRSRFAPVSPPFLLLSPSLPSFFSSLHPSFSLPSPCSLPSSLLLPLPLSCPSLPFPSCPPSLPLSLPSSFFPTPYILE